jgi:hypothetical protein
VGWLGFQADGSPVRTAPEYRDWVRAPGGMETDSDDRELPFDRRLGEFTLAILRQRHAPGELGNKHT